MKSRVRGELPPGISMPGGNGGNERGCGEGRRQQRAPQRAPNIHIHLAAAYVERWRGPRGASSAFVLNELLRRRCISRRPRWAWFSYSLTRTDPSEKEARRTHARLATFCDIMRNALYRTAYFAVMGSFRHASERASERMSAGGIYRRFLVSTSLESSIIARSEADERRRAARSPRVVLTRRHV